MKFLKDAKKKKQQFIFKLIQYIAQVYSLLGSLLMSWAHLHCRQYTAALLLPQPLPGAAAVQVSLIF